MVRRWTECPEDEGGATAVEYGVLAACIALALVALIAAMGGSLTTKFGHVTTPIAAAGTTGS